MSSLESFGGVEKRQEEIQANVDGVNVTESAIGKVEYVVAQTEKKMKEVNEKLQQLERVENNPVLLRRVLVSEPCDIRLPNGTNGRLTNIPAVYYVRRRTELGIDLANTNGELVGHIERSYAREWNARYVFRPVVHRDGRQLHFYRSSNDCRNRQHGNPLPAALQQPNIVFPILETRRVFSPVEETFYLVGLPIRNAANVAIDMRFPAWVSEYHQTGARVGEEGILTTLADRRVLAAELTHAIHTLPRADQRAGNDAAIETALARMRMAFCTFITGQELSDISQFNNERRRQSLRGLQSIDIECLYQTTNGVQKMDVREYGNWVEHLHSKVDLLRRDPEGERFTLHNAGASRSAWQFISTAGMP